jgi:hypothetical protein
MCIDLCRTTVRAYSNLMRVRRCTTPANSTELRRPVTLSSHCSIHVAEVEQGDGVHGLISKHETCFVTSLTGYNDEAGAMLWSDKSQLSLQA